MFLPCTLALYGAASLTRSIRVKNAVLLFCSVCFYGYGGLNYLGLLAVSVVVNWGAGLLMEKEREADDRKKASVRRRMIVSGPQYCSSYWNFFLYLSDYVIPD